jgi:hypothetical protein
MSKVQAARLMGVVALVSATVSLAVNERWIKLMSTSVALLVVVVCAAIAFRPRTL